MKANRSTRPGSIVLWLVIMVPIIVIIMVARRPQPDQSIKQSRETLAVTNILSAAVSSTNAPTTPTQRSLVMTNNPGFQLRPFAVAKETAAHQWTAEDGKDTNVIQQLAHNPLEYDRMVEENSRIFRRQLVYLKEPAAAVFEQAKLTGQPVRQLTLPGVDGQEHQFEIVKNDGKGSSRQGMFSGKLAGNSDSLVTLAFMDGREAFTILSPKENIFIVGEPREDGQIIVKVIDPNTYGVGPLGDDAIINTNSIKK